MEQKDRGHSLHAYTKEENSNLTLSVVGQIKAKGDFVGIKLVEVPWSEQEPDTIGLKFSLDEYDPNGPANIEIMPFHKKLKSDEHYKNVVIKSQQGNIYLEIETVKGEKEPSFAGGGSEVPRGF